MDFNGLVVETNDYKFFGTPGMDAGGYRGSLAYSFDFNIANNLACSEIEMTYYSSESEQTPLAYLKTTLKFWVSQADISVEAAERVLFSVKSQSSFMIFMLYQKFGSLNVQNFVLISQPDKVFYDAIVERTTVAALEFNGSGAYSFPF